MNPAMLAPSLDPSAVVSCQWHSPDNVHIGSPNAAPPDSEEEKLAKIQELNAKSLDTAKRTLGKRGRE